MATRPNRRHALLITPAGANEPIVFTFEEKGAASAVLGAINTGSDARAEDLGPVMEVPVVVSTDPEPLRAAVEVAMRINFSRAMPGRRLLALRDYAEGEDDSGPFATATALWVPGQTAAPSSEEA